MDLKIVTPDGVVFSGAVAKAIIPTADGEITVLPQHIPLISQLAKGLLTIEVGVEKKEFQITGGVLEVRKSNHVIILADSVELLR